MRIFSLANKICVFCIASIFSILYSFPSFFIVSCTVFSTIITLPYFDVSACFLVFSRIDINYVCSVALETVSLTQGHLLPKAVHSTVR